MFGIIGKAIGAVGNAVTGILGAVDKLDTTEHEKLQMKAEILRVQNALELELAQLSTEFARVQADVIKAELASDSGIAKSWRPILMLTFGFIIVYAVVAPAFGAPPVDMTAIPKDFWDLVTVGVGGYVTGRTVEKVAPTVADAFKNRA